MNILTSHLKPLINELESTPISKKEFVTRAKKYTEQSNLSTLIQMLQFHSAYRCGDEIILN